jgi:hypothetical protein
MISNGPSLLPNNGIVLLLFLIIQNSHPKKKRVSLYLRGGRLLKHGHHSKPALSTLLRSRILVS